MHLFLILRYVGVALWSFGIPIVWMICQKEKRHHPRAERWITENTPKWFQVFISALWPIVLVLAIFAISLGAIIEGIRLLIVAIRGPLYRLTHRKEIARQKKLQEEALESQRKYQEKIQEQIRREQHADKYL